MQNLTAKIDVQLEPNEAPSIWGEIFAAPMAGTEVAKLITQINGVRVTTYFDSPQHLLMYCAEHNFDVDDKRQLKVAA